MEQVRRFLFEHPLVKALALGLFGLVGNVLAGAYVFDITENDPQTGQFLDWWASPHSWSFWGLAAVLLLMGLYGWGAARFEARVRKALTQADVRQRVLEELLDPLLDAVKKDIREGKVKSMDEVMAMFDVNKRRLK